MNNYTRDLHQNQLETPVLFITFCRPGTTRKVFEKIRQAQPKKLYIAQNFPSSDNTEEIKKWKDVRAIIENVDWDCDARRLYRERYLGVKTSVSSAIDWFFENVEEGIILEDDCLPSQSFFWFCQELLEKYRNDTRIMCIGGSTYVEKEDNFSNYSYHFARTGGIWGWASWRRAWKLYEPEMESWPQAKRENIMRDLFTGEPEFYKLFNDLFEKAYQNNFTWDYQWAYSKLIHSSLNIMPCRNLICNIGFGTAEAAHTHSRQDRFSNMRLHEIKFPLKHPKFIVIDRKFNYQNFKYITHKHVIFKIARIIASLLPSKLVIFLKDILLKDKGI